MDLANIAVIGDGGWGTTLAIHLSKKGYGVQLWSPFTAYAAQMQKNRYNRKFLPGIKIPEKVKIVADLNEAMEPASLIVFAVPSKFAGPVLRKIKQSRLSFNNRIFLSVTKGIDYDRLLRISELAAAELGDIPLAVLSGPTIAREVAEGLPSTAVVACANRKIARHIQSIFNSETFRVYTNSDVTGVEIGGSIKNIIALACGICDGLGYGSNTKAAILTRGLAEMSRLGVALGANARTFSGLSGLGDLVTTCVSPQSRNRSVGELIGKGKNVRDILEKMDMVAEGVETVRAAKKLADQHGVDMPITQEIYNIIYQRKKPRQAVEDLMGRKTRPE
jgi:glycerol-3-phosphate dehydrogenase (NAD(P)+)